MDGGGLPPEKWSSLMYGSSGIRNFVLRSELRSRRFAGVVYVLHAFQKKAKKGIATPRHEIELIKSRLRDAEMHYRARIENGGRKP